MLQVLKQQPARPRGEVLADWAVGRTKRELKKLYQAYCVYARDDFWEFRQHVHPDLLPSWWQQDACQALQRFYEDWRAGKRPRLVLNAPPQHGKSYMMQDFAAWIAGKHPLIKEIFASYSSELGSTANLHLQRLMISAPFRDTFPEFKIAETGADRDGERLRRNTGIIEFGGGKGSFRNTTIDGQVNGFALDLGIVDDPIKGRAEAQSETIRETAWNWLTNDFFNRFSNRAGLVIMQTRWHVDDPVGRWLQRFPDTEVLVYRAIAEEGDWSVREGFREVGDALFPELKPIEFLLERKKVLSQAHWDSLYQQNPYEVGGGMFPIEKLRTIPAFDKSMVHKAVRYWDKAGSEGGTGAYTAGVLMAELKDKTFLIMHAIRGHWGALEREQHILDWAKRDTEIVPMGSYAVGVEQEPGSGGKESAESTIRNLRGYTVFADRVTGSKVIRAEPFASQVQKGNVSLLAGVWQHDLLNELEIFDQGKYKDQVDACSGAFQRLTVGPYYNLSALAS